MSSNHSDNNTKNKYSIGFLFCIALVIIGLLVSFLFTQKPSPTTPSDTQKSEDNTNIQDQSTNPSQESTVVSDANPLDSMTSSQQEIYATFLATMDQYPDVYAYIDIPDTPVSYPILQSSGSEDYNYYYLDHCIDGTEGLPGTIFTCGINARDFLDFNTVIYGHNMKNESMFGSLKHYSDSSYLEGHPYVYIYTKEGLSRYKIFATVFYDDRLITDDFPKEDEDSPDEFLRSLREVRNFNSWVSDEITVTKNDHIITLSTCVSNSPEERFLVCAVLEK